jgi:hypothetical protein
LQRSDLQRSRETTVEAQPRSTLQAKPPFLNVFRPAIVL